MIKYKLSALKCNIYELDSFRQRFNEKSALIGERFEIEVIVDNPELSLIEITDALCDFYSDGSGIELKDFRTLDKDTTYTPRVITRRK